MVYRAQVIDNSSFLTTGKIRVRIHKHYFGSKPSHGLFLDDLSDKPDKIKDGQEVYDNVIHHTDTDVRVFSPIGGGQDFGMFFLPQVNTSGIVLRLGESFENSNDYLWLGSTFDMVNNTIKMPNDSMKNINGIENKVNNVSVLDGALIIKLKSTKLEDPLDPQKSKDDMNWKKSPIENLIVINKDKVLIEHSIIENKKIVGNETIIMDETGIQISNHSETNDTDSYMDLKTDGGFSLRTNINKEQATISIDGNKDGIEMISHGGKNTTIYKQEHDSINLNTAGTGVVISNGIVNIKSTKDIYVDGKSVNLGPTGLRVVLANVSDKIKSVDVNGVNLQFSDSITG